MYKFPFHDERYTIPVWQVSPKPCSQISCLNDFPFVSHPSPSRGLVCMAIVFPCLDPSTLKHQHPASRSPSIILLLLTDHALPDLSYTLIHGQRPSKINQAHRALHTTPVRSSTTLPALPCPARHSIARTAQHTLRCQLTAGVMGHGTSRGTVHCSWTTSAHEQVLGVALRLLSVQYRGPCTQPTLARLCPIDLQLVFSWFRFPVPSFSAYYYGPGVPFL
jgi:hypothetical protein